jgi:hypothetical protein
MTLSLSLMYTKYYKNMAILYSFILFLIEWTFMCSHFLDRHASLQDT